MDITTFSQKIKQKYPEYQSVDDTTLVNKFIEKYPVYKSQVDLTTPQQKQENIDRLNNLLSGQQTQTSQQDGFIKSAVKDVAGTLLVKPAARTTEAITRTVFPNSLAAQGYEMLADAGESQTIGGINIPQIKPAGQGGLKQVAGEALKSASYLFPYGGVAGSVGGKVGSKVAGNVISGATGGYLADTGYKLEQGQTISESLKPGVGTALGVAIPLAGPLATTAGRSLTKAGTKLGEIAIPTSTREAGILQTYRANNPFFKRVSDVLSGTEKAPQTAGKTSVEKSLFGTKSMIGVQSKRASSKLWNDIISPSLKSSNQAVDLGGFFNKIQDDIIKSTPEVSRQNSLLNALNSFKDDYANVPAVSLEQLQKLKEGWAEFIPEKAYRGENISGAANQVRKLLADESRKTIYSQLGDDVKQAYFDYGNLQGLQKLGKVSMTGSKLKGGTGGLISEVFSQAITPVATVGGQVLYRTGKGLEFIGNLGAKNIGEALGVNIKTPQFPGDKAIQDIRARFGNQEAKAPISTQTNQIKNIVNKTDIPTVLNKKKDKSTLVKIKGKLTTPQPGFISLGGKDTVEEGLISQAKKYKSAEEFVKAQGTPKTVTVWNKSKFSNDGAYTERPVIKKVENKTLYQGGDDSRQFWTPDKKYAEQFGTIKEKTGTFYQIDNGNRMTEVYVDASKTKSQLTDIWNKANKK